MIATDLLKQQHKEVKALFKRLENSDESGEKREIFEELASNLVAHDAIEREIFYPACEEAMGMTELLGESLVEHGVIEFSLYRADEAKEDEDFEFKCTVLKEMLEHHIEEEEDEFFPKCEKALGGEQLEKLAAQMKQRFELAIEQDFRQPLRANLKQVLAGATKTSKVAPTKASKAKSAGGKAQAKSPARNGAGGSSRKSASAKPAARSTQKRASPNVNGKARAWKRRQAR